ncbi:hypothetical protein Nepgr_017515 [Nepenthes gracilis]|uniref:Uncharacterized protein n=1 Tax=Nepenthes gracilis TaxID=150966 RepID=A0AAD3XT61_NEPGR|nr:hypothetical protein Nepgr_017515 [Nepenthes gracilis]
MFVGILETTFVISLIPFTRLKSKQRALLLCSNASLAPDHFILPYCRENKCELQLRPRLLLCESLHDNPTQFGKQT